MKEEEIKTVIVNTIKDSLNRPKPYLNRREIAKYFGVADYILGFNRDASICCRRPKTIWQRKHNQLVKVQRANKKARY